MSESDVLLIRVLATCVVWLFVTMVSFSFLMSENKASWSHDGPDGLVPGFLLLFAFFWPLLGLWAGLKLMWRAADGLGKLMSKD